MQYLDLFSCGDDDIEYVFHILNIQNQNQSYIHNRVILIHYLIPWTRQDLDPEFHPTFILTAMRLNNLTMMTIFPMMTMMIRQTLTKAFIQLSWVMTSQDSPTQAI